MRIESVPFAHAFSGEVPSNFRFHLTGPKMFKATCSPTMNGRMDQVNSSFQDVKALPQRPARAIQATLGECELLEGSDSND